jgi:hypothetical protein
MARTHGPVELVLRFRAADFESWKEAFDAQVDVRRKHGATGHRILRALDDPNDFEACVGFTSVGGARAYMEDVNRFELQRQAGMEDGHHRVQWDEALRETIDAAVYE